VERFDAADAFWCTLKSKFPKRGGSI
jgi:hypothetical protein